MRLSSYSNSNWSIAGTFVCVVYCLFGAGVSAEAETVSFDRQILPLLSDRCFHCHGPDESHREAELRLDRRENALEDRGGYAVVVPGDPDASEIVKRIETEDPSLLMPPVDSHRKPLTASEVELIRAWIASGAKWNKHWAFRKPSRPDLPSRAHHPIDAFVRHRLTEHELQPAKQAATHTLARRLAFDLTGSPPTLEQVRALEADSDAYGSLVDELLESPHYGERMAMWWLDAARYSDTDGFQQDETRDNWPWRDWVIEAFNENKRFDQFTIEQFAGDLLPNASQAQQLATCFHRNHQTNGEGGRDPEESRVDYVIDRVNTVGTVWLGLTLGCCQCHSHKFDPISNREYYQLTAFFNSIDESGAAGKRAKPYLKVESPYVTELVKKAESLADQRQAIVREQTKTAEPLFEEWLADLVSGQRTGNDSWRPLVATDLSTQSGTKLRQLNDLSILTSGKNPAREYYRIVAQATKQPLTAIRLEVLNDPSNTKGRLSRNETGEFVLTQFKVQLRTPGNTQVSDLGIARAVADLEESPSDANYGKVADILFDDPRNGWFISAAESHKPHEAILFLSEPIELRGDEQLILSLDHGSHYHGANIGRFRLSITGDPAEVLKPQQLTPVERLAAAKVSRPEELSEKLKLDLRQHFFAQHPPYRQAKLLAKKAIQQAKRLRSLAGEVSVMVLREREEPRETFVLERGVWDQHGEKVRPGFPRAVLEWPDGQARSRLDLAQWIVSPENPLTARVIVNQLWQLCFGAGLVRTPEDFGLQGQMPTHPELLDWLAVEFVESGWNAKHILRLIVTSETYKQSSDYTPRLLEMDPKNELLARGPRFRLPSWMIRDASLSYAGLLDDSLGGPPVYPYQPEGVWDAQFKGKYTYDTSQGSLQFRRTVYAFWRRSSSPTYLFDIAPRRICEVRTRRTNTPLHALTLMNDVGQFEAARALAVDSLSSENSLDGRITSLFERVVLRKPTNQERAILHEQLSAWLTYYQTHPDEAAKLLDFGQPELRVTRLLPETAAFTVLANLILNLDETITRE